MARYTRSTYIQNMQESYEPKRLIAFSRNPHSVFSERISAFTPMWHKQSVLEYLGETRQHRIITVNFWTVFETFSESNPCSSSKLSVKNSCSVSSEHKNSCECKKRPRNETRKFHCKVHNTSMCEELENANNFRVNYTLFNFNNFRIGRKWDIQCHGDMIWWDSKW